MSFLSLIAARRRKGRISNVYLSCIFVAKRKNAKADKNEV
jgi:hypothetical protein